MSHPVLCCAKSVSRIWLFATPWTAAHQNPLSMGILQARILEWVAMPSSRGSSQPRDQTQVSCIAGRFFTIWAIREAKIHPKHLPACLYTVFVQAAITNYHRLGSLYLHNGLCITYSWKWQRTEQTVEEEETSRGGRTVVLGMEAADEKIPLKSISQSETSGATSRWPWRTSSSAFQSPGPALHTPLVQPLEGLELNSPGL